MVSGSKENIRNNKIKKQIGEKMTQEVVHGIKVDYTKDNLFDELGLKRLKEYKMKFKILK